MGLQHQFQILFFPCFLILPFFISLVLYRLFKLPMVCTNRALFPLSECWEHSRNLPRHSSPIVKLSIRVDGIAFPTWAPRIHTAPLSLSSITLITIQIPIVDPIRAISLGITQEESEDVSLTVLVSSKISSDNEGTRWASVPKLSLAGCQSHLNPLRLS